MRTNGELQTVQSELKARGIRDVKLCLSPGVLGVPASHVMEHAKKFLRAYLDGNFKVVAQIGDSVPGSKN